MMLNQCALYKNNNDSTELKLSETMKKENVYTKIQLKYIKINKSRVEKKSQANFLIEKQFVRIYRNESNKTALSLHGFPNGLSNSYIASTIASHTSETKSAHRKNEVKSERKREKICSFKVIIN
jgi:hypothetical protein